jgi:hypothetical protein
LAFRHSGSKDKNKINKKEEEARNDDQIKSKSFLLLSPKPPPFSQDIHNADGPTDPKSILFKRFHALLSSLQSSFIDIQVKKIRGEKKKIKKGNRKGDTVISILLSFSPPPSQKRRADTKKGRGETRLTSEPKVAEQLLFSNTLSA